MGLKLKVFTVLTIIMIPLCVFSAPTATPTISPGFPFEHFAVDGYVYALTNSANVLYVGGDFSMIGKRIGSLHYSTYTGSQVITPRFPQVDGVVYAIAKDDAGGYYIGGTFNYVAGVYRAKVAHILSDGTLDPVWNPSAGNAVRAISYSPSMGAVYIGGQFTSVAGTSGTSATRMRFAAFDSTTGEVLPTDCSFNSTVYTIAPVPGNEPVVAVGGAFTTVSGTAKTYFALINGSTGYHYSNNFSVNGAVYSVVYALNGTYPQMFLAGEFTSAGGSPRNRLAMFDYYYGSLNVSFNPNMNADVREIYFDEGNKTLYCAGSFTSAGVLPSYAKAYTAAFLTSTSVPILGWNPILSGPAYCLSADATNIYIGGTFKTVTSGSTYNRYFAAAFNKSSGAIYTNFNPGLNNQVNTISAGKLLGDNVLIGGSFSGYNSVERNNLAAIQFMNSYSYYGVDYNINGPVYALSLGLDRLYVGGAFSQVKGTTARQNVAAFAPITGVVDPGWIVTANNTVRAIYVNGNTGLLDFVYLGGDFTSVNSTVRNYAAAVDPATGALNSGGFDPNLNGPVNCISSRSNGSYAKYNIQIGGSFTTAKGGTARNNYAEFSYNSSTLGTFDPNFNGTVYAIHNDEANNNLYIGGAFTTSGGGTYTRNKLASYDNLNSAIPVINSFQPVINGDVKSIDTEYNSLLLAGGFYQINGTYRYYSAAFSLDNMVLSAWNPMAFSTVNAILGYSHYVALGGFFYDLGYLPHGFGAIVECPIEMYTFTSTRTVTPTFTYTRTRTPTYTRTPTPTATRTSTPTPTITRTYTTTSTRTASPTMTGTPVTVFISPFFDTFVDDVKKWDYGTEWERGPATASAGDSNGSGDPGVDVSTGSDNILAGTVIGGNMSNAPAHDYYYMTSSYINTAAEATVQLRYWRFLNTDETTYLPCTVDVFDGTDWKNLYMSDNFTKDTAWTEQVYDVTAYKNSNFRVRFGHKVNGGAFSMSGWNVDDVYVGPPFTPTSTRTATPTASPTFTMTSTATPCTRLDTSFNGTGMTHVTTTSAYNNFSDVIVDSAGNIFACGNSTIVSPITNYRSAVWKYLPSGILDNSFGVSGSVIVDDLSGSNSESIHSIMFDPAGGGVLSVGMRYNSGYFGVISRYSYTGLDTTYGTGGHIIYPNKYFYGNAVIDPKGRIVAAGSITSPSWNSAIFRFNRDGSPDWSFNSPNAYVLFNTATGDYPSKIAIDSQNRILAAGGTTGDAVDIAVWRINEDGTFDSGFNGGAGVFVYAGAGHEDDEASAVTVDYAGRILVSGFCYYCTSPSSGSDAALFRLTSSGILDTSFNAPNGVIIINNNDGNESVNSIAEDANRRIVLAGYSDNGANGGAMTVWRGLESGLPDLSFGSNAMVVSDYNPSNYDNVSKVIIDPQNRIVAAGTGYGSGYTDSVMLRYADYCTIFNTSTPTSTRTVTLTPTRTFTSTITPTYTATRTVTQTVTPTGTPTSTASPTYTATRTFTPTVTPTFTATPSRTATPTYTYTVTPTVTQSVTPTATGTGTFTATATFTYTVTRTSTATPTFTASPTITSTYTITQTSTNIIFTWTITPTHTVSPTITPTFTSTVTGTHTMTVTLTVTQTVTPTHTVTLTVTPSVTLTSTDTATSTFTRTVTLTHTSTFTATPTYTRTVTLTSTSTYTVTATVTETVTATITDTITETVTPTYTVTPTITETRTSTTTRTVTNTRTFTPTASPTGTDTATETSTATNTPVNTNTPRPSITPTLSSTVTDTATYTATRTVTDTITMTFTPTVTLSSTVTETYTFTVTLTETESPTSSFTQTSTPENTLTPTVTETQCPEGILGNSSTSGVTSPNTNNLFGSRFELLQDAMVYNLKIFIPSGSGNLVMAIYTDFNGKPQNILANSTSPQSIVEGQVNTVGINPPTQLSAGYYWIVFQASGSGINFRYANAGANSGMYISNSFGSYPDPFVDDPTYTTRSYAVYASFCPDLGYLVTATVTPTITHTYTYTPTYTNTPVFTPSNTPTVTPTQTRGIPAPDDDAYTYPMPASSIMNFTYMLPEIPVEVTINIYDFAGNHIKAMDIKDTVIEAGQQFTQADVSRLRPGIYYYLIKAVTSSGSTVKIGIKKFIVRR